MTIDSIVSGVAISAGKAVAEKGIREIAKKTSKFHREIKDDFNVLNEDITISCPENIQKCSTIFECKHKLMNNKKRIKGGKVRRATIRSVRSSGNYNDAINYLPDGFEINLKKLNTDDTYILDVDYFIDDPNFLDSFINRHKSDDIPFQDYKDDGIREYWMHAELKHPKILQESYGKFDFQDIDFKVDVGVQQDVKTEISPKFRSEIDRLCELIQEKNPRAMFKRGSAYIASKKSRKGTTNDILSELQEVFSPNIFKNYVDVHDDFYYLDCQRGVNYHDNLPIPTWPKTMDVISRTDITLEKPAASGTLIYKRNEFIDKIYKVTDA